MKKFIHVCDICHAEFNEDNPLLEIFADVDVCQSCARKAVKIVFDEVIQKNLRKEESPVGVKKSTEDDKEPEKKDEKPKSSIKAEEKPKSDDEEDLMIRLIGIMTMHE